MPPFCMRFVRAAASASVNANGGDDCGVQKRQCAALVCVLPCGAALYGNSAVQARASAALCAGSAEGTEAGLDSRLPRLCGALRLGVYGLGFRILGSKP